MLNGVHDVDNCGRLEPVTAVPVPFVGLAHKERPPMVALWFPMLLRGSVAVSATTAAAAAAVTTATAAAAAARCTGLGFVHR